MTDLYEGICVHYLLSIIQELCIKQYTCYVYTCNIIIYGVVVFFLRSLLFATSFFLSISEKCSYIRNCSCMYVAGE